LDRLEAALVEMGQGMTYPATPNFAPVVLAARERAEPFRPRLAPRAPTLRLVVLIAIGLALLAAAGSAAYYVSVNTWLSAGPRGVQFTNDFELVELFRAEPGAQYSHLTIGPDGKEIYAVRLQHVGSPGEPGGEELDLEKTGIVRVRGLQEERVQTDLPAQIQ